MSSKRKHGMNRRDFLATGTGLAAAPLLLPVQGVFAAPAQPDLVVARGGAALAPADAAYQRLKAAVEPLGGLSPIVRAKHVLIKVNATERTSQDANTSVAAAQGLFRLLRECGPADVTVIGQEWGGFDSPRAGQPTLRQVIKDAGATLVELPHHWKKDAKDSYKVSTPKDSIWHELLVAKQIFEPDTVLLNLARLKTHPHCVYTGCIKNVIGLTGRMYGFHQIDDVAGPGNPRDLAGTDGWETFPRKLAEAYRDVIGPRIALNILDAGQPTFGWRGPAPERIKTFDAHTTIVGADALAIDVYGCRLLHTQRPDSYVAPLGDWSKGDNPYVAKNKTKGNYLVECGKLGVGEVDLNKVDIDEVTIG